MKLDEIPAVLQGIQDELNKPKKLSVRHRALLSTALRDCIHAVEDALAKVPVPPINSPLSRL